jgi:hypothetical protein
MGSEVLITSTTKAAGGSEEDANYRIISNARETFLGPGTQISLRVSKAVDLGWSRNLRCKAQRWKSQRCLPVDYLAIINYRPERPAIKTNIKGKTCGDLAASTSN